MCFDESSSIYNEDGDEGSAAVTQAVRPSSTEHFALTSYLLSAGTSRLRNNDYSSIAESSTNFDQLQVRIT